MFYEFVVTDKDLFILFFLGWLQFHRQAEVLSKTDGRSYLSLAREDGQPFQQANETNC